MRVVLAIFAQNGIAFEFLALHCDLLAPTTTFFNRLRQLSPGHQEAPTGIVELAMQRRGLLHETLNPLQPKEDSPYICRMNVRSLVTFLALTLALLSAHAQGPVRLYNEAQDDYLNNRYTQAEEKLALVLKQQKIYPDAWYLWGQCHAQQKEYKKAIQCYNKALKQTPTNVEVIYHKALAYQELGKGSKAVKYLYQATRINPGYAMAWKRLGGIFAAAGGYQKAIDYYTTAIDLDPLDKDAFMLRGNAQAALGNLPEAATDFNYVLLHDADDADAWYNLAGIELKQGDAYEAVKAYSMVIDLRPRDAQALLSRGVTLLALGLRTDALHDLDSALVVDSTFAAAWWNRGYLLMELEQYPEALLSAQRASAINPDDAEYWLLVGRLEFKQRHYKQAVIAYDRCLSLDNRCAEALLNRGEARRVLGDLKGACKDWQQVLKVDDGPLAEKAQNWIDINCD